MIDLDLFKTESAAFAKREADAHFSNRYTHLAICADGAIVNVFPAHEDINGVMRPMRRSSRDTGTPSIDLGAEYPVPPNWRKEVYAVRNALIAEANEKRDTDGARAERLADKAFHLALKHIQDALGVSSDFASHYWPPALEADITRSTSPTGHRGARKSVCVRCAS